MNVGVAAIVLAAGRSTRLGGAVNKVHRPVGGRPVLSYSLETLANAPSVVQVLLVVKEGEQRAAEDVVRRYGNRKVTGVVAGGSTRYASETAGLAALRIGLDFSSMDLIAIHDGARPFVTTDLVETLIATARRWGGAVPGLPVTRPALQAESRTQGAEAPLSVVPAGRLVRMQTPQVFQTGPLLHAYDTIDPDRAATAVDTAQIVEWARSAVTRVVAGDARNLKMTYAEDVVRCDELAREWDAGNWRSASA